MHEYLKVLCFDLSTLLIKNLCHTQCIRHTVNNKEWFERFSQYRTSAERLWTPNCDSLTVKAAQHSLRPISMIGLKAVIRKFCFFFLASQRERERERFFHELYLVQQCLSLASSSKEADMSEVNLTTSWKKKAVIVRWRRGLRLNRKFWEQVLYCLTMTTDIKKKNCNIYVLSFSKVGLFFNTSWHFRTFLQNFHLKNFQTTMEVALRSTNVFSSRCFCSNVFSCQTAGTPHLKTRESNK